MNFDVHSAICAKVKNERGDKPKTCEDPAGHATRLEQQYPGLFNTTARVSSLSDTEAQRLRDAPTPPTYLPGNRPSRFDELEGDK